jgi:hypothetical protein
VTPSHLSRMFRELEDDKLLRRDKGWLVIPAPDKLWRAYEPMLPVGAFGMHGSKDASEFP